MGTVIDFNNPATFPKELIPNQEFTEKILDKLNENDIELWQIKSKLNDFRIGDTDIVRNFIKNNQDTEFILFHCARILDKNDYLKNGIRICGGRDSEEEFRLRSLLKNIGVPSLEIEEIFIQIYKLWDRDGDLRTQSVHFFIEEKEIYKDDQLNYFAINVGGEILRWAMESVDCNLYRKQPYNQLWKIGTPSVIKFKSKLKDIVSFKQQSLAAEIVKYYIIKNSLNQSDYEFSFTGMTKESVPPENIIGIFEIKDYEKMQEKYLDN